MCGFAGVVGDAPDAVCRGWLDAMGKMLEHRGPDDFGYLQWRAHGDWSSGREAEGRPSRLGLVHRRLSILDLSTCAWQPMSTSDGVQHLVYNGEIYNYVELRDELERDGYTFRSNGDTEVVLAAWRAWGADSVRRFTGMFAFALLDTRERALYLARDPFGIKPLYYATWPGGFAFASEISALLELPSVPREADPASVFDYLRFGLTDHLDRTMFRAVRRVPAGHWGKVALDHSMSLETQKYWDSVDGTPRRVPLGQAAEEVRGLFLDNVRLHLRSDVAVGAALSGGIDSSAILMAMRSILGPSAELHAFTYVAGDPAVDEQRWADLVANEAAAVTHRIRIHPEELRADVDDLVRCQGEPFGSTSIYAQYRVFRAASEAGIKVMLDGQGADELLAGYSPHLAARCSSLLRGGRLLEAAKLSLRGTRGQAERPLRHYLRVAGSLLPDALVVPARRLAGEGLTESWLDDAWFDRAGTAREPPLTGKNLRDMLRLTLSTTSLPALLRYEDRNSMAHSIESRVPFLTTAFAELVLSLPEDHLIDAEGVSKAVFRRALRGVVPDAVLDRRDKIGFATPELTWLRALRPWVESVMGSDTAREVTPLRLTAARREWEAILTGRARFDWRVWRWVNLIRWTELFRVRYAP